MLFHMLVDEKDLERGETQLGNLVYRSKKLGFTTFNLSHEDAIRSLKTCSRREFVDMAKVIKVEIDDTDLEDVFSSEIWMRVNPKDSIATLNSIEFNVIEKDI